MIHAFLDFIHKITSPDEVSHLLDTALSGWWFYLVMGGIVFAETGLLVGFILPGDSLLFTLGVVAATGKINIFILLAVLMGAAILGDSSGYFLGKHTGPAIFSRPDSRFFKQEYIKRTQSFFQKYGGKTVVFARFIPVIRSFTTFMAGVAGMPYRVFLGYSVLGSILWAGLVTLAGYFLGNIPLIKNNFDKAIIIVVVISFIPAVIEFIKSRKH